MAPVATITPYRKSGSDKRLWISYSVESFSSNVFRLVNHIPNYLISHPTGSVPRPSVRIMHSKNCLSRFSVNWIYELQIALNDATFWTSRNGSARTDSSRI